MTATGDSTLTKTCTKCGETKDFSQYHAKPAGRFGLHSICKPCRGAQAKAWVARNPERSQVIQRDAKRRIRLTEEGRARLSRINGEYAKRHPKRIAAKLQARIKADPVFAMATRARRALSKAMARGGYTKRSRTQEILGCDWNFFKAHIERQFTKGMSWSRISEIEIDHVVPISSAKTELEVLSLSHYTNLRPMWSVDNRAKSDKITHLI